MKSPGTFCVAALVAAGSLWALPAGASQFNFQSIVQFGAQVQPVTVGQNSQFNGVGILQVGGSSTSATVTQNGAGNYVGILQFGTTGAASVTQTGASNFSFIGQSSIPTFKP
jgi:hypothetical protein